MRQTQLLAAAVVHHCPAIDIHHCPAIDRLPLIEPLFAIIKNQLGARQFRLRGIANVKAEWSLLATAFNLRTLWRVWRIRTAARPAFI